MLFSNKVLNTKCSMGAGVNSRQGEVNAKVLQRRGSKKSSFREMKERPEDQILEGQTRFKSSRDFETPSTTGIFLSLKQSHGKDFKQGNDMVRFTHVCGFFFTRLR